MLPFPVRFNGRGGYYARFTSEEARGARSILSTVIVANQVATPRTAMAAS